MTIPPKKRVKHENLRLDGEAITVFQEGTNNETMRACDNSLLNPLRGGFNRMTSRRMGGLICDFTRHDQHSFC